MDRTVSILHRWNYPLEEFFSLGVHCETVKREMEATE